MTRFTKAALATVALGAFAIPASAQITSNAQCEFEGGEVFTVAEGTVCIAPMRPAEYSGEAYDGQQLGISECAGTELNDGAFCKIVLVPAPAQPEPAADMDMTGEESGQ